MIKITESVHPRFNPAELRNHNHRSDMFKLCSTPECFITPALADAALEENSIFIPSKISELWFCIEKVVHQGRFKLARLLHAHEIRSSDESDDVIVLNIQNLYAGMKWQESTIDQWEGKTVYVQFMLEGDTEVFGFSFDGVPETGGNTASIVPSDDAFVLPPRHGYLMVQNPSFVKSAQNVRPFVIEDHRLEKVHSGYALADTKGKGHVLSQKISLPGREMKISCDVRSGSVAVSLFDEAGKLIKTSHPVTGGLKVRQPVEWPDGFKLAEHVSKPVSLRFDLEGGARLFAIRFDQLFWE